MIWVLIYVFLNKICHVRHHYATWLTPQLTTIICHHMKIVLLKKYKNMGRLDKKNHVNKNDT